MKALILAGGICGLMGATLTAAPTNFANIDARLQRIVDEAAASAFERFASNKLQTNQLAITLVDLREPAELKLGSYRGDVPIYPASVVKAFYLAAAHRWMEDGKLSDTPELRRAMKDMIVDSSNDATHYVLDAITGTTSGLELPEAEMKAWGEKRNAVNRYFASLGYKNINANQKPWCEGPYGRDRVWVGQGYTNRNMLTTDASARLMAEIALERCVNAERSRQMLELLKRDPFARPNRDSQSQFTGTALPAGSKLFSKAGWTSTTRHDATLIERPDGTRLVLVVFTTGNAHANNREIIPFIAREVLRQF